MYKIIIPSFKRNSIIKTHTLKSLQETDLGRDIYVFVANQEEHDLYTNELKDLPYVKIVLGVRGIPNQRNFIQRYFPVGERLLFIDDDIKFQLQVEFDGLLVTSFSDSDSEEVREPEGKRKKTDE